jgi:DNA mismatch repair protein MutS2
MMDHALEVLEFERVLKRVAQRASSEVGRGRIRQLRPRSDAAWVEAELDRVSATMRFVDDGPTWSLGVIPEVRDELSHLTVDGAVLAPLGIYRLGVLLSSSRLLAHELQRREDPLPELCGITNSLAEDQPLEKAIERCVDEEGSVLNSASPELKKIRDRLRGAHAKIVRKLEAYVGSLHERFLVPDGSVTIREGRYVIPVRREGRGSVAGLVHDESQTGATLYIEPQIAIEAMNQLRDLERDEAREIRRVLGEMTARLAPQQGALAGAFEALSVFDCLQGRARAALSWGAHAPIIETGDSRGISLIRARHPLLVEAGEEPVVPFDLVLDAGEYCLVVSGPNTGGKSVFLKATGLISALAQSGIIPPVGAGTRLPVFASFFADIGDEQSIARNLSTFSAHLANLSQLVCKADSRSLVLIDEMGTGTDPAEGAALARAVLEALVERRSTTIVSSHLGDLKRLDAPGSGIVNASLQFDAERMQPTYRLVKGRPGRSYGLAIARRLDFPGEVLDRAEAYRDAGAAGMEDVLARLEKQELEASELTQALDEARARTERIQIDVEDREQTLKVAERTAEDRARRDARKLILAARAEVEDAIRELRSAVLSGDSLDEAAREARRKVEGAAGQHLQMESQTWSDGDSVSKIEEGDRVRIRATGARGKVLEARSGRALVEAGALRFEVALADLECVDTPPEGGAGGRKKGGGWSGPPRGQARIEIDLRGMRVDEMGLALQRGLDDAVREDLADLRVIHGKGTGALRKRVGEILETDSRVVDFRMGGPTEGGAGVTVVNFGDRS